MRHPILAALLLSAAPGWAEVPRVLADTAPVHSLVAMVMGDLGSPELIVPPGTSPHDASLAPSEARALTRADLIVWTGEAFLPWMGDTIASLAPDTPALALLETEGWELLRLREGAHLEGEAAHDDGHDEEEHAADDHSAQDDGHAEGGLDPHAWLDPGVAAAWLGHIAEALSEADPENAATYAGNAARAAEELASLGAALRERLAPLAGAGYAVGHDATQYLERATGLPANWAVKDASGLDPAPRNVAALREAVVAGEVACLLLDAETDPAWADTLGEGTALRTAGIDPDGVFLEPGPSLYPTLLGNLAASLESCLAPQ